jgi:hypothetical protein
MPGLQMAGPARKRAGKRWCSECRCATDDHSPLKDDPDKHFRNSLNRDEDGGFFDRQIRHAEESNRKKRGGFNAMYSFIQAIPTRQLVTEQVPSFAISLVIAEIFYKFHSFTLECVAFLGTWFVIDAAMKFLINSFKR